MVQSANATRQFCGTEGCRKQRHNISSNPNLNPCCADVTKSPSYVNPSPNQEVAHVNFLGSRRHYMTPTQRNPNFIPRLYWTCVTEKWSFLQSSLATINFHFGRTNAFWHFEKWLIRPASCALIVWPVNFNIKWPMQSWEFIASPHLFPSLVGWPKKARRQREERQSQNETSEFLIFSSNMQGSSIWRLRGFIQASFLAFCYRDENTT